ncbi:hypothetical protein [Halomarina rubra]|uniref:Uncharacterized protein n=1 Tax=Halomarina rubra TaxID=2071873 RepID=A0ABD6ASW6_9EURY|nr:hypothetical protein [Halomarina rubra]
MTIDTIRTRSERPTETDGEDVPATDGTGRTVRRRYVDVSDVSAATVAAYARDAVGTDAVGLERRPGRTYLVVD